MEYCESLKTELSAQQFDGQPVQVMIDDRDLRGGEKTWHHIKRGVPIRAEVGPRDVASGSVFMGRRDQGPKEKRGVPRDEFVANIGKELQEIQDGLFARAAELRKANTHNIDSLDEFKKFFTPKNADQPEIHAGFAMCHWAEDPEVLKILKELKVTIRCIPTDGPEEEGTCIFTGKPSKKRVVFAKAY